MVAGRDRRARSREWVEEGSSLLILEFRGNPWGPLFNGLSTLPQVMVFVGCRIETLADSHYGYILEEVEDSGLARLRSETLGETSWWRSVTVPTKSYALRLPEGDLLEYAGEVRYANRREWERISRLHSRGWSPHTARSREPASTLPKAPK